LTGRAYGRKRQGASRKTCVADGVANKSAWAVTGSITGCGFNASTTCFVAIATRLAHVVTCANFRNACIASGITGEAHFAVVYTGGGCHAKATFNAVTLLGTIYVGLTTNVAVFGDTGGATVTHQTTATRIL